MNTSRMSRSMMLLWIVAGAVLVLAVWQAGPGGTGEETASSATATTASTTAGPEPTTTTSTEAPTTTALATTALATTALATTAPPTTEATAGGPPDERPLPQDNETLAAELTEAERMIRNASLSRDESAAWGRRQQQLYRVLTSNVDESGLVVELVADDQRAAVEENVRARRNLSALVNSVALSTTLPAWRIREPLPADELLGYYKEAESETGIPWEYLAAINLVETRMGRIEGLSTAGATGPMQFLPSTWDECCEGDPTIDRDAIRGAAVYLGVRGGPEDMALAVRGYNNSARYLAAVQSYVRVLEADENAYRGYHAWQVYFLSSAGLIVMPAGYNEPVAIDAAAWLAENPEAFAGN